MKHTPTPWMQGKVGGEPVITAVLNPFGYFVYFTDWQDDETIKANAERIVACVNACEGLSNEQLQHIGSVRHLLEHTAMVTSERNALTERLNNALEEIGRLKNEIEGLKRTGGAK